MRKEWKAKTLTEKLIITIVPLLFASGGATGVNFFMKSDTVKGVTYADLAKRDSIIMRQNYEILNLKMQHQTLLNQTEKIINIQNEQQNNITELTTICRIKFGL